MRKILLLKIILIHSSIAWNQCAIHGRTSADGCKAYTRSERIQCEQAFITIAYLDSVLFVKDAQITNLIDYSQRTETRFNEVVQDGIELGASLDQQTKRKKNWRKVGIGAIIIAIIEGVLLVLLK